MLVVYVPLNCSVARGGETCSSFARYGFKQIGCRVHLASPAEDILAGNLYYVFQLDITCIQVCYDVYNLSKNIDAYINC